MALLRAIGAFFARIWRWIKETAWIQPLLIVGLIFAVIFSIPSIVHAVEDANKNKAAAETYYRQFQYSLVNGEDSQADKITKQIKQEMDTPSNSVGKKTDAGDKFFLLYVSESCSSCADAKGGFDVLSQHFTSSFEPKDKLPFSMVTVFTDEVTSDTTTKETAFVKYMNRNDSFFEEAAGAGYNSDYYLNGHITDADLQNVEQVDPDKFLTPTLFLVDFTETSPQYGVSEVMFGVAGADDYKKAELLLDCWNHEGDFSIEKTK